MAKINLIAWRDELRQKRKENFVVLSAVSGLIGLLLVGATWFYHDQKLQDQEQANQLIVSTNQNLEVQLKSLEGLQEQRNAIIDRMKLIQGLQGQRPIPVRLIDEFVRVTPSNLFITRFQRAGNSFTVEGKAESPNTVAEFLRNLEASPWYRNAFMNSFVAAPEVAGQAKGSLIPRIEEGYGTFVVTVALDEIKPEVASENADNNTGATQ
jgi:type IV pilus assembly protein PilN